MIKLKHEPTYIRWQFISDSEMETEHFVKDLDLYLMEVQEPIERSTGKFGWTRTQKTTYLNKYFEYIWIVTTIATGELAKEHHRSTTKPSIEPIYTPGTEHHRNTKPSPKDP